MKKENPNLSAAFRMEFLCLGGNRETQKTKQTV